MKIDVDPHDLREAGAFAFALQLGTPLEAHETLTRYTGRRPRPGFLAALAALTDLDRAQPDHDAFARWHARHPEQCAHLHHQEAAMAALRPQWEAHQYGDRDPAVKAAHDTYARHLLNTRPPEDGQP